MRITNGMINNSMVLNIQRNTRLADMYYNQLASGKKITLPSDDPTVASRALRFRTNVSETEQYQKNVSQAQSWTEITAQAFSTVTEITKDIEELLVRGSTDTLTTEDRQKIMADISSMTEQLKLEMNATYAGRYVFSGYRTDQAPTFIKDSEAEYQITQEFSLEDIQNTKYSHKPVANEAATIGDTQILSLAYKNGETPSSITVGGTTYSVVNVSQTSVSPNPYEQVDGQVTFIPETGELVLGEDVAKAMETGDLTVTYDKKGFTKGDINPVVYFDCTDIKTDSATYGLSYNMDGQNNMEYEIGVGSTINVNSLAKNVVTDKMIGELDRFITTINGLTVSDESVVRSKFVAEGLTGDELEAAIEEQLQLEEAQVKVVSQELFSNALGKFEDFASDISVQETNLGSRMNRLELTATRLSDDYLSYTSLMNDNENVDVAEAMMYFTSADAVYQASLKVGAMISQLSLADYIS
ncbi:MAG: flagellar hook-associated protein FlgL [Lachnospirales bacterium]